MNFWERDLYQNSQINQNKQSNATNSSQRNVNSQKSNAQSNANQGANFNVMEHIARLNGMSDEERLRELSKTASSMKQEGKLNPQELERVYQTAGMFMNPEQLSRLRTLIDMLK